MRRGFSEGAAAPAPQLSGGPTHDAGCQAEAQDLHPTSSVILLKHPRPDRWEACRISPALDPGGAPLILMVVSSSVARLSAEGGWRSSHLGGLGGVCSTELCGRSITTTRVTHGGHFPRTDSTGMRHHPAFNGRVSERFRLTAKPMNGEDTHVPCAPTPTHAQLPLSRTSQQMVPCDDGGTCVATPSCAVGG